MNEPTIPADGRRLRGHEQMPLDDAGAVWLVVTGSLAVFAVQMDRDGQPGPRRAIATLEPGMAAFGMPSRDAGPLVVAAALGEVLLERLEASQYFASTAGTKTPDEALRGWMRSLVDACGGEGAAGLAVPPGPFDNPRQALEEFNGGIGAALSAAFARDADAEARRIARRSENRTLEARRALTKLAGLVGQDTLPPAARDATPLIAAFRTATAAMGLTLGPLPRIDEAPSRDEALRMLAAAARVRFRRVTMAGAWWLRDAGPLVAFRAADDSPVALVSDHGGRYTLVDPADASRTVVTAEVAAGLAPPAFTLYRPFGAHVVSALELVRFGLAGERRTVVTILAASTLASVVGLIVPIATGSLIDVAIPDADRSLLLQLAGALAAAAMGKALFDVARGFATIRLQTISSHVTQAAVWDRLVALHPSFFRQFTTGELATRSLVVSVVHRRLSGATLQSMLTGGSAALNLVVMAAYGGSLALLGVAAAAVAIGVVVAGGRYVTRILPELREIEGRIFGLSVQLVQGVSKLRVTGAENAAFARWADRYETQQRLSLAVQRAEDRLQVVQSTLPVVNSALLFWLAYESIQSAGAGGLSTGGFLAFNAAFGAFLAGTTELGATAVDVLRDLSLFRTAQPILEAPREVDAHKTPPGRLRGRLVLDHVTFRYRSQGALTLDAVSIEATPGQFIALVGPSGSGKSTVLRLLLGFERPESGTVSLDGQDLAGLDVAAVRRQLGVVMQTNQILPGTVYENIAAGGLLTLTEAAAAIRDAGLEDDLATWPMGLHTYISEGGTSLSGGQRQRLLIARALAHRPAILLFDEATSALDNRTQEIVSQSLERLQVTRIVIAHRLSTIQHADRIYVIDGGRVVQEGTYATLSSQDGLFRRMIARQMV